MKEKGRARNKKVDSKPVFHHIALEQILLCDIKHFLKSFSNLLMPLRPLMKKKMLAGLHVSGSFDPASHYLFHSINLNLHSYIKKSVLRDPLKPWKIYRVKTRNGPK